jgi:hypothetical protein
VRCDRYAANPEAAAACYEPARFGSGDLLDWRGITPLAIKRYQVKNTLASLVRPDGYIGYRSDHLEI